MRHRPFSSYKNHMKKQLIIFLALAMVFVGLPVNVRAGTAVSGTVTSPVWTLDFSPYIVSGTLEVSTGAKLTIEPGVAVRFQKDAKILVKGELQAVGEPDNKITFTSDESSPTRGYWGGIEFASGSVDANFSSSGNYLNGSIIKNAVIKYSQGIVADDSSPYLADNLILNNNIGLEIKGEGAGAGQQILLGQASNKSEIATIIVDNNEITDNGLGVLINRSNGNDYVLTPAGRVYQGSRQVTAKLINNDIQSNGQGVVVSQGDNNVISKNNIRHNLAEGVLLNAGSLNNAVERNYLDNNETGLKISSSQAKILQNEAANNSKYGLYLDTGDNTIKNNNIYSNKEANLYNNAGSADLSDNYWGTASVSQAQAGVVDKSGAADITPITPSVISLTELLAPIIDDYINSTTSSVQTVSGVKTTGTAVIINGSQVIPVNDRVEWEHNLNLVIGDNQGTIYLQDNDGNNSPSVTVNIVREEIVVIDEPTVDYQANTSKGSQIISGTKEAGTGIWVNNGQVVDINQQTTWSYNMGLAKGENKISIFAQDSQGRRSQTVGIAITRGEVDAQAVIDQEKSLTTTVDQKLSKRLAGRLLLQVEEAGQIWYVDTKEYKRYFVTFDGALSLFRKLSLGISEENLTKIPTKGKGQAGDKALRERLKGKLLLRVESAGQISYVDLDGYRHDISMSNLMDIFRSLSLGISNNDIRKIAIGETE